MILIVKTMTVKVSLLAQRTNLHTRPTVQICQDSFELSSHQGKLFKEQEEP